MEENSKKEAFIFDTSALISLATIGVLDKILAFAQIITTSSVIKELEEFARFNDKYGKAGNEVLKRKDNFAIVTFDVKETLEFIGKTDNELHNLAKEKKLILVTDDVKLSRRIEGIVETRFSVYFVIALVASGATSKEEALALLETLRELRNWKSNLIYVLSKKQLEKL